MSAADHPSTPGLHENVASVEDPSFTIDLFLPAPYDQGVEKNVPVCFLSSPGGIPETRYGMMAGEHG